MNKGCQSALLTLVASLTVGFAAPQTEAEVVTKRYAEALTRFEVPKFVEELHPDLLHNLSQMWIHIIASETNTTEQAKLLEATDVKTTGELEKLSPQIVTERFFRWSFSSFVTPDARKASLEAKIKIIGSLTEDDRTYVVYRTTGNALEMAFDIPSVVGLRKYKGKFKVFNTTQLQKLATEAAAATGKAP